MNDLDTIESYLTGQMADPERTAFEASLRTDPALANTLAFYVLAQQTAKKAANDRRRAEWDARRRVATSQPIRRIGFGQWLYPVAAAACLVLALGIGWFFLHKPDAPQLADAYINQHLTTLSITMDARADSLQTGIQQYNAGKLVEAETLFGAILKREPTNPDALKFTGLVSLRRGNYDQAIEQFHRLSQRTDLYDNPGLFYEALTRLKRNQPADKNQARDLLTTVITNNLSGKTDAQTLLNDL